MDLVDFCCNFKLVNSTFVFNELDCILALYGVRNVSTGDLNANSCSGSVIYLILVGF